VKQVNYSVISTPASETKWTHRGVP